MKTFRYGNLIIFLLCVVGYIFEFWNLQYANIVEICLGTVGIIYCSYYTVICFQPIKRDWILVKGGFLFKVINYVLFVPFIITCLFAIYSSSIENYSPKNLTYQAEIYESDELPKTIKDKREDPSIFWAVYVHYIDPGNQHMAVSKDGRQIVSIIAILGYLLLNGLLVSTLISWFDRRREQWIKGEVRYNGFLRHGKKKHYVIIGGNDIVLGIIEQIFKDNEKQRSVPYIVVQTSRDVESFRRELFSVLTKDWQRHTIIYYGNRTSKDDIESLCVANAQEVYIIGEDVRLDDVESYHDTMNMSCLKLINDEIKDLAQFNKKNRLTCRVMFEYQTTFNILQVTDMDGAKIKFLPFNYYEAWAQNVLVCQTVDNREECEYIPLEGFDGIKASDDTFVHLVVVGMSRMGLAMAIETAHLAHYPNFDTNKKRTRITFIDANMDAEKHYFMGRFKEMFDVARYRDVATIGDNIYSDVASYPWNDPLNDPKLKSPYYGGHIGNDLVDIEWEFLNGSIEHPSIQQYLSDAAANDKAKLTIAVCIPDNSSAIAAAAYLPNSVYESKSTLQVLVYQRLNDDLLNQINLNNQRRYHSKLKAFGMASRCYDAQLIEMSEDIASAIGDAYDQYAWGNLRTRYSGKGLIEEDYASLSNNLYNEYPTLRDRIKSECDRWMATNVSEYDYKHVGDELNALKEYLNDVCRTDMKEVTTQSNVGKPKSAKMWSNKYNIYSMWTKFRCVTTQDGNSFNPKECDFEPYMLEELGKMEHNRWVVEQLLLRFRPLSVEEQKSAMISDLYSSSKVKSAYKNRFAHLDICSNEVLDRVDYNMSKLDQSLIEVLPCAYRTHLSKYES